MELTRIELAGSGRRMEKREDTSLRPSLAVFGFLPVAMSTWSSLSMVYISPELDFKCRVSVPSSCFSIFVGLHSGCRLMPLPWYCSVRYFLHSSSKPRSG